MGVLKETASYLDSHVLSLSEVFENFELIAMKELDRQSSLLQPRHPKFYRVGNQALAAATPMNAQCSVTTTACFRFHIRDRAKGTVPTVAKWRVSAFTPERK
jgi:hypothetical protein